MLSGYTKATSVAVTDSELSESDIPELELVLDLDQLGASNRVGAKMGLSVPVRSGWGGIGTVLLGTMLLINIVGTFLIRSGKLGNSPQWHTTREAILGLLCTIWTIWLLLRLCINWWLGDTSTQVVKNLEGSTNSIATY